MLIVFGGLPGTGKTTIARTVASELGAVYLRIDSIEQAVREADVLREDVADAGYRGANAIAEDNLRLRRTVVADAVNPILIARQAWRDLAQRVHADIREVEVRCSDIEEHKRHIATRSTDIPGLQLPSWDDIRNRIFEPWNGEHIVIDTASMDIDSCIDFVVSELSKSRAYSP